MGYGGPPQYYRCGRCEITLRHEERWRNCPSCGVPCATTTGYQKEFLTAEEAERLIARRTFERKLNEETEEERQQRHERARADEQARERARVERSAKFPEVIAQGGFDEADERRYAEIMASFPNRSAS